MFELLYVLLAQQYCNGADGTDGYDGSGTSTQLFQSVAEWFYQYVINRHGVSLHFCTQHETLDVNIESYHDFQ